MVSIVNYFKHKSLTVSEKNKAAIVIEALKRNRIDAVFAENADEVVGIVKNMLSDGALVGAGGSVSLEQTGVIDLLRNGDYRFLDRNVPGLTSEDISRIYDESFSADFYFASANAITLKGELFNTDGRSNRVSAICYGPKNVIIIAGINKIVANLDEAVLRLKTVAAPANCVRLGRKTYCATKGHCQGIDDGNITAGCNSPDRICCNYVISAYQAIPGRIKVIIVGEYLGL